MIASAAAHCPPSYAGGFGIGPAPYYALAYVAALIPALILVVRFLAYVLRTTACAALETDEGGIRWSLGPRSGYVPFCTIGDVALARSGWGTVRFQVMSRGGAVIANLPIFGFQARNNAQQVMQRALSRVLSPTPPIDPALDALARSGDTLSGWLTRVRGRVSHPGYRTGALRPDVLLRAVQGTDLDPELRAAAAMALLSWLPQELSGDIESSLRATVRDEAPPILVVVFWIAQGVPSLVSQSCAWKMLSYLSEDDRVSALRLRES